MSIAVACSRAQDGIAAPLVTCEVHLSGGLPGTSIVGLPEAAVKEARDRVRAAILTAQLDYPARRVTVNLAPADLPKFGGRFDLPIALGIVAANGGFPRDALAGHEFIGELALSGELRPVTGVLPAVVQAMRAGRRIVVPHENAAEAALVGDADVRVAGSLLEVCAYLAGRGELARAEAGPPHVAVASDADLSDVRGQPQARRALEIAAAGCHNLLLVGPPGTGKTMLASRLPGILPPLGEDEALEIAAVRSVAGLGYAMADWKRRPFRSPHHTASAAALIGGGSIPRPGEVSLSHHGVLFLDELPEFNRHVLEVLREPLESGRVVISRAARQAEFPARFQLVAAMNPCSRVALLPGVRIVRKALKDREIHQEPQTLGEHLRARRKALGLLQRKAAELMGVCPETVLHWEKGQRTPQHAAHWTAISQFLGYDPRKPGSNED